MQGEKMASQLIEKTKDDIRLLQKALFFGETYHRRGEKLERLRGFVSPYVSVVIIVIYIYPSPRVFSRALKCYAILIKRWGSSFSAYYFYHRHYQTRNYAETLFFPSRIAGKITEKQAFSSEFFHMGYY